MRFGRWGTPARWELRVSLLTLGLAACQSNGGTAKTDTAAPVTASNAPGVQSAPRAPASVNVGGEPSAGPRTKPLPSADATPPSKADGKVASGDFDPESEGFIFSRKLTREQLANQPLRVLSLIRNTIYAQRGNVFVKDWLAKHFDAQPWYAAVKGKDIKKPFSAEEQHNANLAAEIETSLGKAEIEQRATAIKKRLAAGAGQPNDELELRLLSARAGQWLGTEKQGQPSPLEDVKQLDQVLSVERLENLSRRDLRNLRNTIYARRGRAFKSPILQQYFAATDWYQIDPEYTDARLKDADWKNIRLIQSVEQRLGGPILDSDPEYTGFNYFAGA